MSKETTDIEDKDLVKLDIGNEYARLKTPFWLLLTLLTISCLTGLVVLFLSCLNEKSDASLFYAIPPVAFLLLAAVIQSLLYWMDWEGQANTRQSGQVGSDSLVRVSRRDGRLLVAGFVVGVIVSLLAAFGMLVSDLLGTGPAKVSTGIGVTHQAIQAALALGLGIIVVLLTLRLSQIDG